MVALLDGADPTWSQSQSSGAYEVMISEGTATPVSQLRSNGKHSATALWGSDSALLKNH